MHTVRIQCVSKDTIFKVMIAGEVLNSEVMGIAFVHDETEEYKKLIILCAVK